MLISGVVKGDPVPIDEPPDAAAYHFNIPPPPSDASRETVPDPQREPLTGLTTV